MMNIAKKFVLLFLFLSLVPITVISFFSYVTAKEAVTTQVVRQLEFVADLEKGRINALIDQNLERIQTVTNQMESSSSAYYVSQSIASSSGNLQYRLENIKSSNSNFKDVMLLNQSGTVIASTDQRELYRNASDEEFFQKGKLENTIANFVLDIDGNVRVYLAGPLHSNASTIGVVVAVESDVDTFRNLIREYKGLGQTGELLLAKWEGNEDAVYIAPSRFHANAALRKRISPSDYEDPMIKALSRESVISTDTVDYRGKHTLAVSRYIERAGWGLVVKMDRDEAFAFVNRLGTYFMYASVMTALLAMLNAWYFSHYITRPILLLSKAADAIRQGDLHTSIDVYTKDEIGQLAETFREMAKKLRESYGELANKVNEKTAELARQIQERDQQIAKDQALLASIGDGVIVTDEQERIILVNVTAQELLKSPQSQLLSRPFHQAVKMDVKKNIMITEHKNPITAALLLRRKITTSAIGDISFYRSDNTTFPVGLTVTPVILSGNVIGTILVFRDMTVAHEIDRMKTEFISLASHQLRTPLSAIRWFIDMLREGDAGELTIEQKEIAENIAAANTRMIDLVNSLLNLSRLESGKITSDPKPTNLVDMIKGLNSELEVKIRAAHLSLTFDVPVSLPIVLIDPKLIREVFMNLLTNAIKYTPHGGKITVKMLQKGNSVMVMISDTGYGIPEKEHDRVFGKFYRGGNIISRVTEGTGLGLYLVREIINACGGAIWFDSAEGKGTMFSVTLPIHPLPHIPASH